MRSGATSAAVAEHRFHRVPPQRHRPLDPQVQDDVVSPPGRGGPDAVHRRPVARSRAATARRAHPRRTTTRQPTAARAASRPVQDGDPGRRPWRRSPGGARPRRPARRRSRPRSAARRRAVISSARSPSRHLHAALVLLEHHDRARARALDEAAPAGPCGGQRRQHGPATSRRSATSTRCGRNRCSSPAAPPNGVPHASAPLASRARRSWGRDGQGQHARQFAGAEPDRQHVGLPAGGQPDARGRGRPDRVAGRGHVQLGEHVLQLDGGDRVQVGVAQRLAHHRAEAGPVVAGEPVRHEHVGARLAGR